MHRLAGPMHTFVAQNYSKLRGVAVVTVTGRSGASNAVAEITALLGQGGWDRFIGHGTPN